MILVVLQWGGDDRIFADDGLTGVTGHQTVILGMDGWCGQGWGSKQEP
jgi:hypothetical protein